MRAAAIVSAAASCIALAGCGAVIGSTAPAPATYDLIPTRISTVTPPRAAPFQLVVNQPTAVRALGTDRLLVKPGADQISFFKGAAWSDRLPKLIQDRIVQAFQNAGLVKAVGSRSDRLDADIEMASQLNAFQVEVEGSRATARVAIFVKVIDGNAGKMIASRAFETTVPSDPKDAREMVASLNRAFDTVLRQIVPWVAKQHKQI